jgi:hypothetical protein
VARRATRLDLERLGDRIVEDPGATITVFGGSTLTFLTGGSSSALADLKGTLDLTATSVGSATVSNAQALWVDGGALMSTLSNGPLGNVITGDVSVFNTGTLTVGSGPKEDKGTSKEDKRKIKGHRTFTRLSRLKKCRVALGDLGANDVPLSSL